MLNLIEIFEKYADDYLKFGRVENKLHERPDICAFLLLDKLLPDPCKDIVSAADHDQIYLGVDIEKLAGVATEDDIITLIRCGVLYESDTDSLYMFA